MLSSKDAAEQMTWRPITTAHAIERVRFIAQFKQQVSAKMARSMSDAVSKQKADTRLDGPSPMTTINLGLQVGPDGKQFLAAPPMANDVGWQFIRKAANGMPQEVVAMQDNSLMYETSDYRRWTTFRQRFEKVVAPLLAIVSTLDVETISLEFFDRFYFDGPPSDALPADLINGIVGLVPEEAASGRSLWHVHRGWFERTEKGSFLINQNFDSVDANPVPAGPTRRFVSILTKAEARSTHYQVDEEAIEPLLDKLHARTKLYFMRAVRPEVLAAVGIADAEVGK